eukprot:CAMPEP_0182443318 /NCGR_PEP_ID=MMETSP1172-20130603/2083_1 /TAXON_ID=708627 /ORGANISM="Timspurckia oligopyrenoides, Strain CCMP3278" /LENGTH=130 /DNA_ID=CAMNT_0024638555 /DNA_START=199 /DNA_END=591 /DNA_ORIENTATION=+
MLRAFREAVYMCRGLGGSRTEERRLIDLVRSSIQLANAAHSGKDSSKNEDNSDMKEDAVYRAYVDLQQATLQMYKLRQLDGAYASLGVDERDRLRINSRRVGLAHPEFADEFEATLKRNTPFTPDESPQS